MLALQCSRTGGGTKRRLWVVVVCLLLLRTAQTLPPAQGSRVAVRLIMQSAGKGSGADEEEEAKMLVATRSRIGSRPPSCRSSRRCHGCGRCEAVQVPVLSAPLNKATVAKDAASNGHSSSWVAEYDGGTSNYKLLSWKCKCGDTVFDP